MTSLDVFLKQDDGSVDCGVRRESRGITVNGMEPVCVNRICKLPPLDQCGVIAGRGIGIGVSLSRQVNGVDVRFQEGFKMERFLEITFRLPEIDAGIGNKMTVVRFIPAMAGVDDDHQTFKLSRGYRGNKKKKDGEESFQALTRCT